MSEITQFCKDVVIQGPVTREQVMALETAMRDMPDQLTEEDLTTHHFADGVYLREMYMPEGSVVVGKIHRTKHLTIIASGTVQITTDKGIETITGPAIFVSPAGAKKAIHAITEATLMNPHPTEETDLVKIEQQFIAPSFEALDYSQFLIDCDVTENDVQEMTKQSYTELAREGVEILPSDIHGMGVFTHYRIGRGEVIALAKDGGEKTTAGRYCNHSGTPNAEMIVMDADTIRLVALRDLFNEEITTDYRNNIRIQEKGA